MEQRLPWWQTGVIYQIYPRSFADADGDGVGDLRGIVSRLDYLEWLGVDAIWLSPFYPSPMADFGYDISDYCDVDTMFGGLADFDELLDSAHRRGVRVILDLVPSHTSEEHSWFEESRSSRDNPKRSFYIWRDPAPDGGPPNNWESVHTGDSAWEWDGSTGQYYLHTFQVEQPDLNWDNPEVREAMYGVMRFWLDRGVDGFRIDALPHVTKDLQLRDNPPNPEWVPEAPVSQRQHRLYSEDRPEILDIVQEMRAVVDEYEGERVLIGEIYLPLQRLMEYYGKELDGLHMPFNFGLVLLESWSPRTVGQYIEQYESALPEGAAPNWVLGNHDNPRVATRVGPERARTAQMLLLTLRGSPTVYYGDEIGMLDAEIPLESIQDPQGLANPAYNRDPARTPMQWDQSANFGFSAANAEPWLPIPDHEEGDVKTQRYDPYSMLSLFRRLIELRREIPALTIGSYRSLESGDPDLLAYAREYDGQRMLVALNFGPHPATLKAPLDYLAAGSKGKILCSTNLDRSEEADLGELSLRPHEGVVVAVS